MRCAHKLGTGGCFRLVDEDGDWAFTIWHEIPVSFVPASVLDEACGEIYKERFNWNQSSFEGRL